METDRLRYIRHVQNALGSCGMYELKPQQDMTLSMGRTI